MLGSQLSVLAKARGLRQSELASSAGISSVTLSRFFNNKVSVNSETLNTLLGLLGIDLSSHIEERIEECTFNRSNVIPMHIKTILQQLDDLNDENKDTILRYIEWFAEQNRPRRALR
jgi:transcriptional regulator with XRE-family HTH domain